jgi:hypothetical protein
MKLYLLFLNFVMNNNIFNNNINNYINNYKNNNKNNNKNNDLNNKISNVEKRSLYKKNNNDYLNIKNDKKIDIINLFLKMELLEILEINTSTIQNKLIYLEEYQKNLKNMNNNDIIKSINITNGGLYNDWNYNEF